MTDTKINFDLSGLDKLRKQLGENMIAKVGYLGSGKGQEQHAGTQATNTDIALVHEFGSATNNIPPRSTLRMPIEHKKEEIVTFLQSDKIKKLIEAGEITKVYQLLGVFGEKIVQEAFESGGFGMWPPLKEATIKAKGGDAILIDTGQLRRAVSSEVAKS